MFRHRVPRLNHRRRRSTPVNHCLAVKVGGRQCGVAVLSVNFLFLGVAPRGTMHAALRDHHRQGRTRARKGRRVKFEVIVNLYS